MHWTAPSEKDTANDTLEKRLWAAADQFRANSGLSAAQYSQPVLGLIFLRFAEVRFAKQRAILEKADASALNAAGWTIPERFTAKGRDGKTDIFGIIIKPSNFDAAKKYPVVEEIYAGPHGYFVPKEWGRQQRQHALAELGFIVVQMDGMGTNWRSRAFHDVAWRNL